MTSNWRVVFIITLFLFYMELEDLTDFLYQDVPNPKIQTRKNNPVSNPSQSPYSNIIDKYAHIYGVDPNWVTNLIFQESMGNPRAVSQAGAQGLGQLMPNTAKGLGVVKDPFDPEQNIHGTTKYLSQLYKRFHDKKLATAAYNAGPGNVEKYKGIPPFAETQNYVRKVLPWEN